MTQLSTTHAKGGWRQDEIDLLFSAVEEAAENGTPLRDVFASVGVQLSRRPNSIRNFYYARVRENPEASPRQASFRSFTPEELHALLRNVLMGRGQGESVRACVTRLSGGDKSGTLRYQNKYRSILKNKPELLLEIADELRAEGLPCPEQVIACRQYGHGAKESVLLSELRPHLSSPQVLAMVENLLTLLQNKPTAAILPRKWQELQRENDRLKVENDLLKMALEDAKGALSESAQTE